MPHNPNKLVRRSNFHSDFCNYWVGTIVTYKSQPFKIIESGIKVPEEVPLDYSDLLARGRSLSQTGTWSSIKQVSADELCYDFPRLGFIKTSDGWYYTYRNPQRRMCKGYNQSTVGGYCVTGRYPKLETMRESIIRQVFYGNTDRITPDCIIDADRRVWYEVEHIATIQEDGTITFSENREKMGAYVCKLLGNSSVAASMVPNLVLPNL